jgi:ABC-type transporter Mla maintaining outer membrane lipid asymmetry ATPase subunit MlaF
VSDAVLELSHVRVRLGGRVLLDDVSCSFERGRVHAVVGRSGTGKSLLMKAAAGLLPIERGTVQLRAPLLVYVHQDPALLDDLTVFENVAFAVSRRRDLDKATVRQRITDALRALDLAAVADRLPGELPPGTLRRAALARALCLQPEVLIVDEPTTGLDPDAGRDVDNALAAVAARGTTLIVITHSPRTLARLEPRILRVDGGQVS